MRIYKIRGRGATARILASRRNTSRARYNLRAGALACVSAVRLCRSLTQRDNVSTESTPGLSKVTKFREWGRSALLPLSKAFFTISALEFCHTREPW